MTAPFVIAHLYPRDMSIYGDLGNVITLRRRLEWRGHPVEVRPVEVGAAFDPTAADIIFGGGGQDSGQLAVGADLQARGEALRAAAAAGVPMLLVCGLYQLFGHAFVTEDGRRIPGIGVFDAITHASAARLIGNVVLSSGFGQLVGFENHSGRTLLGPDQAPLGRVVTGGGNDGVSGAEGAVAHAAVGTYLHGPVLPNNPRLADHLIGVAMRRRGRDPVLAPLDDGLETVAAAVAARRPR